MVSALHTCPRAQHSAVPLKVLHLEVHTDEKEKRKTIVTVCCDYVLCATSWAEHFTRIILFTLHNRPRGQMRVQSHCMYEETEAQRG